MGSKARQKVAKVPGLAFESIERFDQLIATCKGAERKGKTTPYTSRNGHMFSFLSKDGMLNLRLPSERRESFLREHKTKLSVQYGTTMKEYVVVPSKLFANTKKLARDFGVSWSYIGSLKPKPTKRR